MNLIQKSTKTYQLNAVTSIANNILSFFKYRFRSNPLSFHLPNYDIFDYVLTANSPMEMVYSIHLIIIIRPIVLIYSLFVFNLIHHHLLLY